MTAILKVDTIQDTAGNNIINESSDTITIGASGDTITIPAGATIANSGTATGFGKLLQVVNGNFGTEQNISSTSYVNSAVTLNITPSSSSSKIMVVSALNTDGYVNLSDNRQFYLRLNRDSTVLQYKQIQIGGEKNPTNNYVYGSIDGTMVYLDSPSSTSQLTYTVAAKVSDTNNNCNVRFNGTSSAGHSTMTLLEVD